MIAPRSLFRSRLAALAAVLLQLLLSACEQRAARSALVEEEAEVVRPGPIEKGEIVFGTAGYDGVDVAPAVRPLISYLTLALHVPVRLRVAEPYEELPRLVRAGAIDIAQLAPLPYVRASAEEPRLLPLVTVVELGSPTYLGHLYVREDSPYRTLADLQGARIAYVSERSSSGYLFPRDMLRQKGYDPDHFFGQVLFAGGHPQVLDALLRGEVDVAAAFDVTVDWQGKVDRPKGLRVVAKTDRIPNDCIVARAGFDRGTALAVRKALLALRPGTGAEADRVLGALKVNGWVPADESRYDRVRQVLQHEGISVTAP